MKPTVSTTSMPIAPMRAMKPMKDDFQKKEQELKEQLASLDQQKKQHEAALKNQEAARLKQLKEDRTLHLENAEQFEELSLRALSNKDKIFYVQEAHTARKLAAEIVLPDDDVRPATSVEPKISLGISTTKGIWGLVIIALFAGILFWAFGTSNAENDSATRMINSGGLRFLSNLWMSLGSLIFGFAIQWCLFPQQFFYYHSKFNTERCLREDFVNPSREGMYRIACWCFTLVLPIWVFVSIFQVILA